jgi:plastocyanin
VVVRSARFGGGISLKFMADARSRSNFRNRKYPPAATETANPFGDTNPLQEPVGAGAVMEDGTISGTMDASGTVQEFTVTGSNFKFVPGTMSVKKGDTVKITFVNSGGTHDWNLDEFNAHTGIIQGGATKTVTFVADQAGSFEYYCSVGNHRAMGMRGTLTVTPQ